MGFICLCVYPSFFKIFLGSVKYLASYPLRCSKKCELVSIQSARHYYENIRLTFLFDHLPKPSNTFPFNSFHTVYATYRSISDSRYDTQMKYLNFINTECYRKVIIFYLSLYFISNEINI